MKKTKEGKLETNQIEKYQPQVIEPKWPHKKLASRRRLSVPRSRGALLRGKQGVKYQPAIIEPFWQNVWRKSDLYKSDLSKPNKYYVLAEYAYPSGDLHMGHWFTFSGADVYARFKRMQGHQVFFPNGFDAFGLPAENAAIKRNIHPRDWTLSNIEKMKEQYATMGASFTFDHEVISCLPEFYKWNQWIFLKMFEKGLAYKGSQLSNWCNYCQTVLANEGVENGTCWRCHNPVVLKEVEQWFFRLTEYADKLIWPEKLQVDWPKSVRDAQNAWIGRSEGMNIQFQISNPIKSGSNFKFQIDVYTVFPETIFGVTYMVLAPEHPFVSVILNSFQDLGIPKHPKGTSFSEVAQVRDDIAHYVKRAQKKSELERTALEKDKTGVFTGSYCINPVNGEKVPVWIADYVIGTYGTGAVMGVPGSDHRDFEFAKKYNLPIRRVIGKTAEETGEIKSEENVLEEGYLVNSGEFSGLKTPSPARDKVKDWIEEKGFGKRRVQYHIRDWSISRQRYWGTPIPIIYCRKCWEFKVQSSKFKVDEKKDYTIIDDKEYMIVPVPEEDLPVLLPYEVDYTPKGKPPLATNEEWLNVKCPKCGGAAKRDAETMDTFVDSSWYFFRYLSPKYDLGPFDQEVEKKIMPVDIYFGGAEHTLGHTLYSRFLTKFFHELGLTTLNEYAAKRVNHGVILGPDGARMSKSKGNVVNPDEEVKKFGADTIRVFLAFFMPYEGTGPWVSERVYGAYRFLQRVWGLQTRIQNSESRIQNPEDMRVMHKTIKKVTEDIQSINFNTAVAALMEWLNYLSRKESITEEEFKTYLLLLSPFAPHITEEIWQRSQKDAELETQKDAESNFGVVQRTVRRSSAFTSIHQQSWPVFDKKYLVEDEVNIVVQVNGKVRDSIKVESGKLNVESYVEELAKESERVKKHLEGKKIVKVIYIEGKIINFVVS